MGQSIDSAEYAALEADKNKENGEQRENNNGQQDNKRRQQNGFSNKNEQNKPEVEEAVIKIQALVRGHLTRKALKDAHSHNVTRPNALGQSQFDEDSLTKNRKYLQGKLIRKENDDHSHAAID